MDQKIFTAVDEFIGGMLLEEDEALRGAVEAAEAAGLPSIQVSPPQGKLLQLLVRLVGAKRILEFGTLGGYSAILMARGLPADGRLISLEANAEYAEGARRSIERAGVGAGSRSALGRRWRRCRASRRRARGRSTSSSSTPTRSTRRTTSTGRSAGPAPGA